MRSLTILLAVLALGGCVCGPGGPPKEAEVGAWVAQQAVFGIVVEFDHHRWAGTGWGAKHITCQGLAYTLVVTCNHVVPVQAINKIRGVVVWVHYGKYKDVLTARWVTSSRTHDVSVLLVRGNLPVLALSDQELPTVVSLIGRPECDQEALFRSTDEISIEMEEHPDFGEIRHLSLGCEVYGGFSGSPVLGPDGKVCGMVWGGRRWPPLTLCVPLKEIRETITAAEQIVGILNEPEPEPKED